MPRKLIRVNVNYCPEAYIFVCPGCGFDHIIYVQQVPGKNYDLWDFNGDLEKPTFNPSLLLSRGSPIHRPRCHSFIREGKIQFLDDCDHALKGQTVDLKDVSEDAS